MSAVEPPPLRGPRLSLISRGTDETLLIGRVLGGVFATAVAAAEGPRLICVQLGGTLGAGKTHLAKGIVAGLGGDPAEVTSPTFTLEARHATPAAEVCHIDAYRLDPAIAGAGPEDPLFESGLDDALTSPLAEDPPRILLIEWAARVPGLDALQASRDVRIDLEHAAENVRVIHLAGLRDAEIAPLLRLAAAR